MRLLVAFAPFLAFLLAQHAVGIVPALGFGAAVAAVLVVRERMEGAREASVLEIGTATMFGALAICAACMKDVTWSVGLVRLFVDCGLMLIVLGGVVVGRPFTLALARPQVSTELAASPGFLRINREIACVWAGAFGVLALADLILILQPTWPLALPIAISGAGVIGAMAFTRWWPRQVSGRGRA